MTRGPLRPTRRRLVRAAVALILLTAIGVAAFLPFAGRFLVVEDPLEPADLVFVLAGSSVERWLEAADLYKAGIAPRIILSPGMREPAEDDLARRGIRIPTSAEIARVALVQLGVPAGAIAILPRPVDNTAQEAAALTQLLAPATPQRVLVVTSKYHTRRTRFAFRRAFAGTPVDIRVRATRYDRATPARWWERRQDFRFVTSELQKLVAYRLGLGE